ncbi:MAG: hypothetical protein EHM12_08030 [Dehalococcoidia bacterium]|nr:MAG: hypothetical protein EHM12_08030 [Dehalococcoidia bacterium]
MDNIGGKINLRQLVNVVMNIQGKAGNPVKCLVLPIEVNKFFESEDGKSIYLDMIGFPIKERKPDKKDTHIVKQSFSKEVREKMTDEQLKALPILGNFTDWSNIARPEAEPNTTKEIEATTVIIPEASGDDLPF